MRLVDPTALREAVINAIIHNEYTNGIPPVFEIREASIRPFATGRRAWLFADSPKGATANAVLNTLVESARANELDVYEYLNYLLSEIPNSNYLQQPEVLENTGHGLVFGSA